ncbi:MAG: creatininase family protein [archaeon]|nr:creatininase family protein [archaeon]
MNKYIVYMESTPAEMEEMIKKNPIAYIPFGALEWHSTHNVLGTDSIISSEICKRSIEITGGVLFPCVNWGAFNTMNFPYTYRFSKKSLIKMTRQIVKQSYNWGFKILVLLTGHYPSAQIKQVRKAAEKYSKKYENFHAIGIAEQCLVPDMNFLGDHAAMWETSMMMAINPDWVNLEVLPNNLNFAERTITLGIMGIDPKIHASKELGEKTLKKCVERLSNAVLEVKEKNSIKPFNEIYSRYDECMKEQLSVFRNGKLQYNKIFENQGIESIKEGIEIFKWQKLNKKKYNPDYQYPKKF